MTNDEEMRLYFDAPVNRRNSGSLKWDVGETELPMWVADMDFPTAPAVREALARRVEHGVFGYSILPDAWFAAYQGWWKQRHHFSIFKEWLIFCTGVVPAISTAVRKFTSPAEQILLLTPVYNIFFNSIVNNGRRPVQLPLVKGAEGYTLDFEALEKALAMPQLTMLIFCNPHNPVGKIWDRETLARIGELCRKHHVLVLSDEIHCDLCDPGKEYVPFAAASDVCRDISISCIAPTKAFNLAGLQTAAVVVPNDGLRARMERALNTDEVAEPNAFAVTAAVAAFTEGGRWLDLLREYLFENKRRTADFLRARLPEIRLTCSEATYLLWLDCEALTLPRASDGKRLAAFLRKETGLYLSSGEQYGEGGEHFLRMNIACPRKRLEDGLLRLEKGILAFASNRPKTEIL